MTHVQTGIASYPGSKSWLIPILDALLPTTASTLWSPFFGSGKCELSLAQLRPSLQVKGGDIDPLVCHYVRTFLQKPDELQSALTVLRGVKLTKDDHLCLRRRLRCTMPCKLTTWDAALYALMLHFSWNGQEKNYTRRTDRPAFPQRRCSNPPPNVTIEQIDALELLRHLQPHEGTFVYLDPPYPRAGPRRYVHGGSQAWHVEFAEQLKEYPVPYILSLPDTPSVRASYRDNILLEVHQGELLILGPAGQWRGVQHLPYLHLNGPQPFRFDLPTLPGPHQGRRAGQAQGSEGQGSPFELCAPQADAEVTVRGQQGQAIGAAHAAEAGQGQAGAVGSAGRN